MGGGDAMRGAATKGSYYGATPRSTLRPCSRQGASSTGRTEFPPVLDSGSGAGMRGVGGVTLEEGGDFVGHEIHLAHEGVVGFDAVADEVEDEVVEASVQVV